AARPCAAHNLSRASLSRAPLGRQQPESRNPESRALRRPQPGPRTPKPCETAVQKKTAEPSRTPPFPARALLGTDQGHPYSNCIGASIRWTPVARVTISLRASLYGLLASTRYRLTMNLATNQCAQRRDRTNVCKCHLDHLLQLPWALCRRVPPTEAARPYRPYWHRDCRSQGWV